MALGETRTVHPLTGTQILQRDRKRALDGRDKPTRSTDGHGFSRPKSLVAASNMAVNGGSQNVPEGRATCPCQHGRG